MFTFAATPRLDEVRDKPGGGDAIGDGEASGEGLTAIVCMPPAHQTCVAHECSEILGNERDVVERNSSQVRPKKAEQAWNSGG